MVHLYENKRENILRKLIPGSIGSSRFAPFQIHDTAHEAEFQTVKAEQRRDVKGTFQ